MTEIAPDSSMGMENTGLKEFGKLEWTFQLT
jgi:hypothetical protein